MQLYFYNTLNNFIWDVAASRNAFEFSICFFFLNIAWNKARAQTCRKDNFGFCDTEYKQKNETQTEK